MGRIAHGGRPKTSGAALSYELAGYWKYRIGACRIFCRFQEEEVTVVAVGVGHPASSTTDDPPWYL